MREICSSVSFHDSGEREVFQDHGAGYRWKTSRSTNDLHFRAMPEQCRIVVGERYFLFLCDRNEHFDSLEIFVHARKDGLGFRGFALLPADGREYIMELASESGGSCGRMDLLYEGREWESDIVCSPIKGVVPDGYYDLSAVRGAVTFRLSGEALPRLGCEELPFVDLPEVEPDGGIVSGPEGRQGPAGEGAPFSWLCGTAPAETWDAVFEIAGNRARGILAHYPGSGFTDGFGECLTADVSLEMMRKAHVDLVPILSKVNFRQAVISSMPAKAAAAASGGTSGWGLYSVLSEEEMGVLDKVSAGCGGLATSDDIFLPAPGGTMSMMAPLGKLPAVRAAERVASILGVASSGVACAEGVPMGGRGMSTGGFSLMDGALTPVFPPGIVRQVPKLIESFESLFSGQVPGDGEIAEAIKESFRLVMAKASVPPLEYIVSLAARATYQHTVLAQICAKQTESDVFHAKTPDSLRQIEAERAAAERILDEQRRCLAHVRASAAKFYEELIGHIPEIRGAVVAQFHAWTDERGVHPSGPNRSTDSRIPEPGQGPRPDADAAHSGKEILKAGISDHAYKISEKLGREGVLAAENIEKLCDVWVYAAAMAQKGRLAN